MCDQAEPRWPTGVDAPRCGDRPGWAGVTGPGPAGGGATDRPGSFLDRLELILAARVGMEMPDTDRDIIDEVVGRVLGLLAGSAALNRSHPLADATVWLLAHVLEDPALHRKVTGIRLELPGLTRAAEDFDREVAAMHWLRGETGPDGDRR